MFLGWVFRLTEETWYITLNEVLMPLYRLLRWPFIGVYHLCRLLGLFRLAEFVKWKMIDGTRFAKRKSSSGIRHLLNVIKLKMRAKIQGKKEQKQEQSSRENNYQRQEEEKRREERERQRSEQGRQEREGDEKQRQRDREQQSQQKTQYKTPYEILNVEENAEWAVVKKSYIVLCQQYHPDKVNHLGQEFQDLAHEKFKAIQKAYEEIKRLKGK